MVSRLLNFELEVAGWRPPVRLIHLIGAPGLPALADSGRILTRAPRAWRFSHDYYFDRFSTKILELPTIV
jgi:hypothetical protein